MMIISTFDRKGKCVGFYTDGTVSIGRLQEENDLPWMMNGGLYDVK